MGRGTAFISQQVMVKEPQLMGRIVAEHPPSPPRTYPDLRRERSFLIGAAKITEAEHSVPAEAAAAWIEDTRAPKMTPRELFPRDIRCDLHTRSAYKQ